MAGIEGSIVIDRPVDVVFDFVADQRNEPAYNPRMLRAEKVTDGPVGQGSRFRSAARSMGRTAGMLIELTGYERPARLASVTTMPGADISGTLTFQPVSGGTLMRWSWVVQPKGLYRLMGPVIAWVGRRQEREIWANLKRYLEAKPSTQSGIAAN
jgi:uncharacterized membrane protein